MPTIDKQSFQTALDQVRSLIADFEASESALLGPEFSEQAARKDYIDKFFTALGWDVHHKLQKTRISKRSRSSTAFKQGRKAPR
jgi:adenine-specific DNA-methyltransferase